ncbi:MAG: tRNA (adenosine(37)-N6)-threonylcarbamoyltransferase complex transferase subunit TsaD [Phycisphaerales bacterium]|nr:tRNA (adenosine(37)-N6)-threonylcarbamoyltransferase complex transferase subunit TsaD [Phycisphaerales bacterium]
MNILAIESSCDDTSAAIVADGIVLSNVIAGQKVHEQYGGVVPEMASRAHIQNIVPTVAVALQSAELTVEHIHAVAFTQSPGLIGSLLVGAGFAKAFAQARKLPLIAVHHMQAHVLAHFIGNPKPSFPFLCLTVSGGHTQLVLCKSHLDMQVIGETIDDAAGEAFDKTAKMLGLPYPGGPLIDQYAALGNPLAYKFPSSPMLNYQFSFSGLKTSVLYFLQKMKKENTNFIRERLHDICASVQHTIINILIHQLKKAAQDLGITQIGIAGGVSANSGLRAAVQQLGTAQNWQVFIPDFQFCTDNAAMIGITAHYKMLAGQFANLDTTPSARAIWPNE